MTSITLLSNWFCTHTLFTKKAKVPYKPCTGYAGAYPKIKRCHRQQSNLFSCIPFIYSPKKNQPNSSIKGCASFARFGRYEEGESEDNC